MLIRGNRVSRKRKLIRCPKCNSKNVPYQPEGDWKTDVMCLDCGHEWKLDPSDLSQAEVV